MKKVEAIVLGECLEGIQRALADAGISGLSVTEGGQFVEEPGSPPSYYVAPRIKVELFCEDHQAPRISQIFAAQTFSKTRDPARVFITQVEEAVRLRLPYVPGSEPLAPLR